MNLRAKGSVQVFDWLKIENNMDFSNMDYHNPINVGEGGSNWRNISDEGHPTSPIFNPDGSLTFSAAYSVGDFIYGKNGIDTYNKVLKNTTGFTASFLENKLHVRGDFTFRNTDEGQTQRRVPVPYSTHEGQIVELSTKYNDLKESNMRTEYIATNLYADYEDTFGDAHYFKGMVGYNYEQSTYKSTYVQRNGLLLDDSENINLALGDAITTSGGYNRWRVAGGFFRLNYAFKDRYLLEVNGRYDGSSKYKSGSQWGFFPSVSVGWRLSEEKFFEPARNLFDNVKLRASIGTLGNQVTNGNFDYLGYLDNETLSYVMGGKVISGLKAPTLASTNITWEKVTTTNFGLDIAMLNNRLNASFDYYIRNTNDMVISKTYPAVLGSSGGKENLANMRTNGWELSVSWNDKINNVGGSPLMYSIGVGLADSYSTITKFDNPEGALNNYYEGKRIGEIWGYVTDGFIQDEAEAQRMATIQGDISKTWKVGDIRYKDLDGVEGITSAKTIYNTGDQKVIGNTTPRYSFNINASASWKGFDVRVFFEGIAKRDLWIDSPVFWGFPSNSNVWQSAVNDYHVDNSWSENNTNAYYTLPSYSGRSKQTQTKYLQNGAYIRLKDLTISYTIPKAWISTVGIEQLKVFASGQNLWVGTKLFKYLDPDIVSTRQSNSKDNKLVGNLTSDGKAYPFSRTFSFGINLTF